MLKNFFINAVRNMRKQRGYVLLNVGGLAIGFASFLFITFYVIHELSYDRFHKNYENIYRVKIVGQMAGGILDQAVTCAPMANALVNDYPEVLVSTRATRMGAWLIQFGENRFNEDGVLFADSTFFKDEDPEKKTYLLNQTAVSFDFPQALGVQLLEGRFFSRDYGTDSTAVLINETAVKSLGLKDPIGKFVLRPSGPQQFQKLKIIGVMKDFNIQSMHKAIFPVIFTVPVNCSIG